MATETVYQELNRLWKPYWQQLGFRHKGRYYYRIVNDEVLQTFSPQLLGLGEFTVNIGVKPLCCDNELSYRDGGDMRLTAFRGGNPGIEWKRSAAEIENATGIMIEKVFPSFEKLATNKAIHNVVFPYFYNRPNMEDAMVRYEPNLYFSLQEMRCFWLCVRLEEQKDSLQCIENHLNFLYDWKQSYETNTMKYIESLYENSKYRQYATQRLEDFSALANERIEQAKEWYDMTKNNFPVLLQTAKANEASNLARIWK